MTSHRAMLRMAGEIVIRSFPVATCSPGEAGGDSIAGVWSFNYIANLYASAKQADTP